MKRLALILLITMVHTQAMTHEAMSLREYLLSFGADLDAAEVSYETIAPGLHVLYGAGGNVVVSIGDQGVLMVDSQFPEMIPKLKAAIHELGGGNIDFTINTHWHFDHADGNPMLGREGSWLISHINSRRMMLREKTMGFGDRTYIQAPYPPEGLPVFTFDERMQMFFNGQRIDILHFGAAHTTGDAAVFFRNDNVVHMGDTFFANYPFIDTRHGGHLDGMITFCNSVLDAIDGETQVVPGHGLVLSYDDLTNYVAMLETVRDRVSALIDLGYSLEAVMEANPTEEFDATRGNPTGFIRGAYDSLSQ
jgi:glyoxylase-like metal-dependent hydrolase (beta-lactamase superfamily II)